MNAAIKGINEHFLKLSRLHAFSPSAAADAFDAAKAHMEREAAHPEALMMNAEFDVARDAERERLQELAAQHVSDERPMLNPAAAWPAKVEPAQASLVDLTDAADAGTLNTATDFEIIEFVAASFEWTIAEAAARMKAIDYAVALA